jgi:hypothetical protein
MIEAPPVNLAMQEGGQITKGWRSWFAQSHEQSIFHGTFTTSGRPTNALNDGAWGIDTTLGKPVWYYDGGWVDATGSTV